MNFLYLIIKIRRCGMIANDTSIHQNSNEEDGSYFKQPGGLQQ